MRRLIRQWLSKLLMHDIEVFIKLATGEDVEIGDDIKVIFLNENFVLSFNKPCVCFSDNGNLLITEQADKLSARIVILQEGEYEIRIRHAGKFTRKIHVHAKKRQPIAATAFNATAEEPVLK
jgi:hypothetical protein